VSASSFVIRKLIFSIEDLIDAKCQMCFKIIFVAIALLGGGRGFGIFKQSEVNKYLIIKNCFL
jgi:hypothetical protein